MRFTWIGAVMALSALSCGGKKTDQAAGQQAGQPGGAGSVIEVKMTGDGTKFWYEPSTLTVAPGTTVRFINVAGGPHNIGFYPDSIPAGAADVLNAAMANRMDNLSGPLLTNPNDQYDVSFAGAPAGTYKGFCLPHVALGMKITITVQ